MTERIIVGFHNFEEPFYVEIPGNTEPEKITEAVKKFGQKYRGEYLKFGEWTHNQARLMARAFQDVGVDASEIHPRITCFIAE